jgi:hypothetical protein
MTIYEIIKGQYSCFDFIQDKRKKSEAINAAKYIHKMSSIAGIDIAHWNILEVFKREDGSIHSDKMKINEILFSNKDHKPKYVGVTANQVKALDSMRVKGREDAAGACYRQYNFHLENSNNYYREYLIMLKHARENYNKYELLKDQKTNLSAEVEKVIADGFFKLERVAGSESVVEFITTQDIFLNYLSDKHKAKMSVNVGQFRIRCYLASGEYFVSRFNNNTSTARGYYHPHVNTSGYVCFGEEKHRFNELAATGQVSGCMEIIRGVLTSYYEDSPYENLHVFKERQEKIEQEELARKKEEEEQKRQTTMEVSSTGEVIVNPAF